MYHCIASLCCCGIFKKKFSVASFADDIVSMDHHFDDSLKMLYEKMDFSNNCMKKYNPTIQEEQLSFINSMEKGNMLQRNALLLSRVFIENAIKAGLDTYFTNKKTLRILDIGCGYALNLIGILAYLGNNKQLKYTGIDINKNIIKECQTTYSTTNFPNVTFKVQDGLEAVTAPENQEQFDLVLMQHPNLEDIEKRKVFRDIFMSAENVLNVGGIVYSSFYYASEEKYFKDSILPTIKGTMQKNDCFKNRLINRFTREEYAPESFCYISEPKQLKLMSKVFFT